MAVEDYLEPEVGVAVALTAAIASPKVRSVLRRGAVYGLAGLLTAGDAISSLAQGVKIGVQKAARETASGAGVAEAANQTNASQPGRAEPSAVAQETPSGSATEAAEPAHKRSRKSTEAAGQ